MEDRSGATPTTRLAPRDPGLQRILVGVAVVVGLAILKPWAWGSSGAETARPLVIQPRPIASPTPTADPRAGLRRHCPEPSGWLLYAHERWSTGLVRSWKTMQPAAAATGPLDPALPVVRVSDRATGLGYCGPWRGDEQPPDGAELTIFMIAEARSTGQAVAMSMFIKRLAPSGDTARGGLFRPVGALGSFGTEDGRRERGVDNVAVWPRGRYVFALASPGWERWWVVLVGEPTGEPG